ncbi:hypothetical protein GDO78_010324 [Eleutherodactylus coqui]|uniref:Uncharacterized protein n=1 Tax=Eleutherodactylus coqui TaxID=57060 RepID=A0A8J6F3U2_ELECQ|nr:hypothetical protein GDO78_010324 [Eleutherodactylus coqui]
MPGCQLLCLRKRTKSYRPLCYCTHPGRNNYSQWDPLCFGSITNGNRGADVNKSLRHCMLSTSSSRDQLGLYMATLAAL